MNYLVKSHLKHNGKEYFEGDTISLIKEKYVEPLVERDVIEPVEEEPEKEAKAESQDEEEAMATEGSPDYSEMGWNELQKEASRQGVLKSGMSKDDVIEALRE